MKNDVKDVIKTINGKLQEIIHSTVSKDALLKELSEIIEESDLPGKTKFESYNFFLKSN